MAAPWLLIAITGLIAPKVCCQLPENFGSPPPVPAQGVRLYQGVLQRVIPNYAMLAARDFLDRDTGNNMINAGMPDGVNDGLWCQSANPENGIGSWQLPDGDPVSDDLSASPVHMANTPGQVGLLRSGGIGNKPQYEGMYICTIPDENEVNQELVVWAAGNGAYDGGTDSNPNIPHPLIENEISFIPSTKPRYTDPPELILSFDVKVAPPTYVTCQVDNNNVDVADLSREVISRPYSASSTDSPVTNVNVTLRTSQAGSYHCNVSVFRASDLPSTNALNNATTSPINITVTEMPTNVSSMRTGLYTVEVSWSAPATVTPPVAGYEVFYAESGSGDTVSGANTTSTTTTIIVTLPELGADFDLFVVAFSDEVNALHSVRSTNSTINLSVPELTPPLSITSITTTGMMISWTAPQPTPTGYMLTRSCMLLCGDPLSIPNTLEIASSSTSETFSDVSPGSQCNITLTAQYGSASSNELMETATTLSEKPSAAPTGFEVVLVDSSFVTLAWDNLPCSDHNGPLMGFLIRYTPEGGADSNTLLTGSNNQLTELDACTNYTLSIAAQNGAGTGDFSSPLSVVTSGIAVPEEVVFGSAITTFTSISISWTGPSDNNGVVVEYVVQFIKNGTSTTENITELMYMVKDLAPSTLVEFSVRAVSICGLVGESSNFTGDTDDIPVTAKFSTDMINNTAVAVAWDPVSSPYLDHYTVYYYPDPDQSNRRKRENNEQTAFFPAGSSSGVIGGLEEGQNYLFALAVTFNISGQVFEGERTSPIPPDSVATPPPPTDSTTTTASTTPTSSGSTTGPPPQSSNNIGPIVGAVVGIILIAVIIVVVVMVVVLLRRRQNTLKGYELGNQQQKPVHFSKSHEKGEEVKLTTSPVIENFPGTTTVEEGQQVELKVFVSGIPKPSYQWYCNGQRIEEDYAHEVTEEGCLILSTAESKHNGTYKLVATNPAGTAEDSLKLIVNQEKMDEDTAPVTVNGGSTHLPAGLSLDAIPVAEFGQYVANCHAETNKGFRNLYSHLASQVSEHPATIAITPANKPFNRFANIIVYDDNRIVLKPIAGRSDCKGDYINASYIDGYSQPHKYIATQGPMNKTLVDFWRLVWQEKPQTIVMVTNLKEEKKVKCQLYWPETGSQDFGPFRITLQDQQVFTDYTIRLLQVELPGGSEYPHRVTQCHFTSWPDHGVPEYATPILTLHRYTRQNHKPKRGPMLVHCSAGIGRTGTFLAIDMALEKIHHEGVVDICNLIIKMREQRMKMVQTVDQFIFICDAILESITCGDTQIPTAKLRQALSTLRTIDHHTGKTGFQQQFEVLTQVTPNPTEVKHDVASRYPDQNRTLEFAPPDKHRVPLKGSSNDYINATFVNGYKQKKAFIIAQSPMESTCKSFWKMVAQRNCGVIIMLCGTQENGKETCAQYWPSAGETKVVGDFVIDVQDEVNYPGFVERTLLIKEGSSMHKVVQFQITNWQSSGRCSNLQTVVSVQEEMYKVQRRTGNNPVVVHCSNTVGRSGMFCAIATAIDRCKTEGLVDVFQVIKAQRIQKPGLVQDVAQYELVFEAILAFLDSFETYTNFQ